MNHIIRLSIMLWMALVLVGCGLSRPKPNASQSWGVWSAVPGTSAYKARRAEGKEDKIDEAKKQMTRATEELVGEAQKDVRTNAALIAAGLVAKQNVQLHGLPDKPIDTSTLISTNMATRDDAWKDILKAFDRQQEELAYIRKAFEKERSKGAEVIKQDSTAGATAWEWKQSALRFFIGNWYVVILGVVLLWYAGKMAARIYCPPIAMGMNVVQGFGGEAVRRGFTQLVGAGERFKAGLDDIVEDPDLVKRIKEHFRSSHERSQDLATQEVVKTLTKKAI